MVRIFLWLLPIGGALAGALTFVEMYYLADSAPQQAAGAAMAATWAILPYVVARAGDRIAVIWAERAQAARPIKVSTVM
jgi:hypothetical protein